MIKILAIITIALSLMQSTETIKSTQKRMTSIKKEITIINEECY